VNLCRWCRRHERGRQRLHYDLTHRTTYGAAHGVFGTIYDIGDAAGPNLGGLLVAALGYARTFQVVAAVVLVAAVFFLAATSHRPGPEPEARSPEPA
jgi:DHA1 family multidrug resistance protein-like MFS transporter